MFRSDTNLLFKVLDKIEKSKCKSLILKDKKSSLSEEIIQFLDCMIYDDEDYYIIHLSKYEKVYINEQGLCIESKKELSKDYIEKITRNPFFYFE
jgi:hypothetical protein